tara:strand:+ start:1402 stop:1794 length:393 start_codon:yes stop_codon:yes gene_type:complete
MNPILANIYGTHGGLEKTAAELPEGVSVDDLPDTLSDLALMIISGEVDGEIEKTAAQHKGVLDSLIEFDAAGRHVAQAEFSEMEKAAADGDPSALEAFFSDVDGETELDQKAAARQAILAELERRGIKSQ